MSLSVVVGLLLVAPPAVASPAETYKKVSPSVVLIASFEGDSASQGSGVAVDSRTVVTNWHVVESGGMLGVKSPDGGISPAVLIAEDKQGDLALLRLLVGELPPARPEVGELVYAIGAPQALERSMSRGIISAIRQLEDGSTLLQTDAAISHGSSGGGLFDERGRLVGITKGSIETGQALNFAVPSEAVRRLMERGISELAAQRTCQLSSSVTAAFFERISPTERRTLGSFLARTPCPSPEFVPTAEVPAQTSVEPAPVPDPTPTPSQTLAGPVPCFGLTEKIELRQCFDGQLRAMTTDEAFMRSRGWRDCNCSLVEGVGGLTAMMSAESMTEFEAELWKLTMKAAVACSACQLRAFAQWKSQAVGEGSARYSPVSLRHDGRVYVRVFPGPDCVAEVLFPPGLPGPVRAGLLYAVPTSAREIIVRAQCLGFAELYFGKEEKPRVSESFAKNQSLRMQFGP